MTVPIKDAVRVNFGAGLDLKNDPKQIAADNFLALNNCTFTTGGQLTKRNGFAGPFTVTTSSPPLGYSAVPANLAAAKKVFSYNDELCLLDGFNLYSWNESSTAWNYKGRSTTVELSTQSVLTEGGFFSAQDESIDTTSGVKVVAGFISPDTESQTPGVIYSIIDTATGQILSINNMGSTYIAPRCISIAGKSWVFAINTTNNGLYYQAIVGNSVSGSPTSLISPLNNLYTFTVSSANATASATYTNNGNTFTVVTTIASGTTLLTTGTGAPSISGTLTKAAGTGDSTITFSAVTQSLFYDIDVDSYTGNIYLAYYDSSPGITIALLSSSLAITASKNEVSAQATNGISWFGDGTNIWVVYNDGTNTNAFIVNNAVTSVIVAPFVVAASSTTNNVTGVWSSVFNTGFVFWDNMTLTISQTLTAAINYAPVTYSGSSATVLTPRVLMGSVSLVSKAFSVSGIPHVVGVYNYNYNTLGGVIQPTTFLLNLYNITSAMISGSNYADIIGNIAAKVSADEAQQVPPYGGVNILFFGVGVAGLCGIRNPSTGVYECALLQNVNYAFDVTQIPQQAPTGVIDCQFNFNLSNPDVQVIGNNAIIAGGEVAMYDGGTIAEQNFHIYPGYATGTPSTSGGLIGSGGPSANMLYGYTFTYEWLDNDGQVHRSFPSPVLTPLTSGQTYTLVEGTTSGSVALTIPTIRVTNKPGTQVVINVYRTTANESIYFLTTPFGSVLNNPTVDTVSYTDGASDAYIQGNIQLYTTGGLGYYAPPATSALTNFKNRAINVASEDPYQFGYSNAVLQNFPAQFVPEFLQNIGTVGGPLVAVAQMDDKMVLFKGGIQSGPAIYYMVGQGPAPSGAGNDFQDPLPVAVDAGCVDRPSIVLTPVGLMFKSSKGIYLLNRGLQAEYIGAPVEAYNAYDVLSAQLIPNTTQVRFLLASGATDAIGNSVTMLVYDYFYKKWGTFSSPAGVSDCIFQGMHTYVSARGQVYQETPGIYIDGNVIQSPVTMSFATAWIKLAGLVGYQRAYFFYLLGEYYTAHQVQLRLYTDYSTTPDTTPSFTPSTDTLENWRVFFAKQRCQAFQVQFQEVFTGTYGQGLNLSGLNLIVGAKNKFRTISAAQSTG